MEKQEKEYKNISFAQKLVAKLCGVCVDKVLIPLMISLCEVEYELLYHDTIDDEVASVARSIMFEKRKV